MVIRCARLQVLDGKEIDDKQRDFLLRFEKHKRRVKVSSSASGMQHQPQDLKRALKQRNGNNSFHNGVYKPKHAGKATAAARKFYGKGKKQREGLAANARSYTRMMH